MYSNKLLLRYTLPFLFLFYSQIAFCQWNANAGLINSNIVNTKIEVSSGTNKAAIVDGNLQSYWESTSPLPENYIKNNKLNVFLNHDKYIIKSNINNIVNAFDGIVSTNAKIIDGKFDIRFKKPEQLYLLSVKINTADTVWIIVSTLNKTLKFSYVQSENYSLASFELPRDSDVKSISLKCRTQFEIYEIAGLSSIPTEDVIFDMGKVKPIGWISSRHYNGDGVVSISVLISDNKVDWVKIASLNPLSTAYVPHIIKPEVRARYIKVKFVLIPRLYQKAKLLEFDVYDSYGPYGKPQKAQMAKNTYAQSFGIVAIWGWGYDVYSDRLSNKQGPGLYIKVAKLARNYHSLDWDIKKPGDNPGYAEMKLGKGTMASAWLNWDREYSVWKAVGYNIDACIMFNNQYFNDTLWHNTKKEAMYYGKQFALHFSKNTSLITMVEVGNEPWEYSKKVYRNILAGMSKGLSQNADRLTILPCATQAYSTSSDLDNYISNFLDLSNTRFISGLNTHIYSYTFNDNGNRIAVNPEDIRSEVWSISNLQRFSAANLRNMPIYVTEFGYDSDGGGDDCTHDVCISEFEQAIYGTRMTLILYRLGVSEFYWYYYADVDYKSFMHNRSGLTSSYSKGMHKKMLFHSFELLQELLGSFYFHNIIMENDEAYVYAFSDSLEHVRRVVAWLPTSKDHAIRKWVSFPCSGNIDTIISLADSRDNVGQIPYSKTANGDLNISLSGVPVVILLKP